MLKEILDKINVTKKKNFRVLQIHKKTKKKMYIFNFNM